MRKAHLRDGAALCRFLAWFAREAPGGELTEIAAAEALEGFRRATGCLSDLSFDSISGAGSNGAIVHYRVTRSTNRTIARNEMFLIDSGGQYPDGTTDVTRTVMVGAPTAEMKRCFTLVLKGHIALATARFPAGTIGMRWMPSRGDPCGKAGLDYDHGTGHGVGAYLSVHEGPQNISKRPVSQPLLPGFPTSRGSTRRAPLHPDRKSGGGDPMPRPLPGGERPMMAFETITMAPIDLNLVEASLLTDGERAWLNAYHAKVLENLAASGGRGNPSPGWSARPGLSRLAPRNNASAGVGINPPNAAVMSSSFKRRVFWSIWTCLRGVKPLRTIIFRDASSSNVKSSAFGYAIHIAATLGALGCDSKGRRSDSYGPNGRFKKNLHGRT